MQRCFDTFWKYRREKDRAEDGGRRAEDDREEAEVTAGLGVDDAGAGHPDKNLTTEPERGVGASEVEREKEISAEPNVVAKVEKTLADLGDEGMGPVGKGVLGGRTLRSALQKEILGSGPLRRRIS